MGTISKDGVYRVGDAVTGSQIQYRKGTVLTDEQEADLTYVGPYPDLEAEASADPTVPENKAQTAPDNKRV